MASVAAAQVKALREKTGAGMMDCKKALGETGGDMERAVDWLRAKGLAAAARKAGRAAAEGLVGAAFDGTSGALVEINSETDFVARNEDFQRFVAAAAEASRTVGGDLEALRTTATDQAPGGVADGLTALAGRIGENLVLRRSAGLSVESGAVAGYVHNSVCPGLGRIGVLVALRSAAAPESLAGIGKNLAMHVAAARPLALDRESVDPAALERERDVVETQAKESGRPAAAIDKIIEGRMRKWFQEMVLLEQIFVIDNKSRVREAVEAAAQAAGAPIEVAGFLRFELGEGVEKRQTDFAAEVAAQAGAN